MRLAGKRVLVSGGAGFIGSHLVDVLAECSVRIFDDFSTGREENIVHHRGSPRVEIVRGDVRDPAAVAVALQGIDVVFHLACRGVRHSIGKPAENHDVNATGTLLLLAAARRAGVERFVHVSSSEVYGTARYVPMDENHPTFPETVYGAAKLAGECYARAYHQTYGLATVIVRPFNNFGPRSHHEGDSGEVIPRFTVWALNGKAPIIFGDGNQTRDFMYVAETTYWLCRVAECDRLVGGTINLSSGRETPILALADLVYETVGGKRMVPVFQPSRPGDVRRHQGDVEQARRVIGFEPKITLGEGIRKLVAHFRSRAEGVSALLNDTQPVNWTTVP